MVAVVAKEDTKSSIQLIDDATSIYLTSNKVLFDSIQEKDSLSSVSFMDRDRGSAKVTVHSGKISLKAYTDEKENTDKIFERKNEEQTYEYDLKNEESDWGFFKTMNIDVLCLETPCVYELGIKT